MFAASEMNPNPNVPSPEAAPASEFAAMINPPVLETGKKDDGHEAVEEDVAIGCVGKPPEEWTEEPLRKRGTIKSCFEWRMMVMMSALINSCC